MSYSICLSVWLISLSVMPSGSIHAVTKDRIPFFLWRYIYSHINDIHQSIYIFIYQWYISVSLSIYIFIYQWTFACFHVLAIWIMLQWTQGCIHLFVIVISLPLYILSEVGLLDHMVDPFLTFWGPATLYQFIFPPMVHRAPLTPYLHQHVSLFLYQFFFFHFLFLFYFIFAF